MTELQNRMNRIMSGDHKAIPKVTPSKVARRYFFCVWGDFGGGESTRVFFGKKRKNTPKGVFQRVLRKASASVRVQKCRRVFSGWRARRARVSGRVAVR